jgi:NADPH:quinone reductase-like Zn-dependent oxidoreductase
VGTFVVQAAKQSGAEVTGVDGGNTFERPSFPGADRVIDYALQDLTRSGKGYHKIIDVTVSRSPFDYRRSLNPDGVVAVIGGRRGSIAAALLPGTLAVMSGKNRMGLLPHKPNLEELELFNDLRTKGRAAPLVDSIFPLSELPAAFRHF